MMTLPREPFTLPVKKQEAEYSDLFLEAKTWQVLELIKRHFLAHSYSHVNYVLRTVWNEAYNKGLSDMDKMHKQVDECNKKNKIDI